MAETKSTGNDPLPLPAFTEEDFLERATAVQERLLRENPDMSEAELDLKLSTGWYKPAFDLSQVLNESVPKDIQDKLVAACQEFIAAECSRAALEKFRSEARTLLASHEKALQLVEDTLLKNPNIWDQMHEHVTAKAGGSDRET
ncbi:hypothetical protein TsFJ059_009127 [Trichoderma semiorbis]|uniref:Uncharacterized protein n=1 Tax=Trichoderma semiorbis TaxID=1491008 RepID=A0A9P8HKV5_9HYPO|nr:hypothetical protein TsFJ059_009127 [Trichoderma semiorbis]